MDSEGIFESFKVAFKTRKFSAGLLVAMIDFTVALGVPGSEINSYHELVRRYPRRTTTSQGARANTLIVDRNGSTLSLRPAYNEAERLFRSAHHRYDYPSCAPHATQAWEDYKDWLDALCKLPLGELQSLRERVISFVLDQLPDQSFVPGSVKAPPPIFRMLLEEFDFNARTGKEPTGAAFQGAAFGFIRADNPHLQVEIDKVRTGSKRLQRVGDIDAWDGERLAVSAEVKSLLFSTEKISDIAGFINEVTVRGAIGILIALSFGPSAKESVESYGLVALDLEDLTRIARLWDPAKQKIAVESMFYYAAHVEKNSVLLERMRSFVMARSPGSPAPL